jgi:hypothetical protein
LTPSEAVDTVAVVTAATATESLSTSDSSESELTDLPTEYILCYFEKKYVEIILKLIYIICAYFLEKYIEKYMIILDTFSKYTKIIQYMHKLYIVFP